MPTTIVIGGQFGDEGKGKIVDYQVETLKPDLVVRFNGGGNAGHTIRNDYGHFALHHVPSGVFRPGTICILAGGMVVDLAKLQDEFSDLEEKNVSVDDVLISQLAHIVMPWHLLLEEQEEEARGEGKISTTGQGIGPCYSDRAGRRGIQIRDLAHPRALKERVNLLYRLNQQKLGAQYLERLLSEKEMLNQLLSLNEALKDHFADTEEKVAEVQKKGGDIILEGAQGTLLDVDLGLYPPYVTSSHTTAMGAYLGSGVKPASDDRIIGVFKAYVTRVGEGPFPTEVNGEEARILYEEAERSGSAEVGATTGRLRRVGWPDLPLMRYSQRVNRFTELAITKPDILDTMENIQMAIAYRLSGRSISLPPRDIGDFRNCKPQWMSIPGWQEKTSGKRRLVDLPEEMKFFLKTIEDSVGVPIGLISVGPKREETIDLSKAGRG